MNVQQSLCPFAHITKGNKNASHQFPSLKLVNLNADNSDEGQNFVVPCANNLKGRNSQREKIMLGQMLTTHISHDFSLTNYSIIFPNN